VKRYLISIPLFFLVMTFVSVSPALSVTINFDEITATGFYADVTPGGPRGPLLVYPDISFNGGVVMSDASWLLTPSAPNLYGTSNYLPLADNSVLLGYIIGTFSSPVSNFSLDIINGQTASTFWVDLYDGNNVLLNSSSVALTDVATFGSVGNIGFGSTVISWFKVRSEQDYIDFAIDNVRFNAVPEPSTILLLCIGLAGIGLLRKRLQI
jgi:hypothetical protein